MLKGIDATNKSMVKAVASTVKEFGNKSRGPSWVSQEVRKKYNIKLSDFKSFYKGTVRANPILLYGIKIDTVELKYTGRLLTASHFKMKPGKRPKNRRKKYTVSVDITGTRKNLPKGVFLGSNGKGKDIPWQRVGRERTPIEPIKTISAPQMITSKRVSSDLNERINAELGKRLDHHINRIK